MSTDAAWLTVLFAMLGGAIRVSTPFLFVSLGECLTEKSQAHRSGLEGTLRLRGDDRLLPSSYLGGSPWLGVRAGRAAAGPVLGAIHGAVCRLPRVDDRGRRHRA